MELKAISLGVNVVEACQGAVLGFPFTRILYLGTPATRMVSCKSRDCFGGMLLNAQAGQGDPILYAPRSKPGLL